MAQKTGPKKGGRHRAHQGPRTGSTGEPGHHAAGDSGGRIGHDGDGGGAGIAAGQKLVVETSLGKVWGRVGNGVFRFAGVPYAADTGGANRFHSPQPRTPWPGIRKGFSSGDAGRDARFLQCIPEPVLTSPDVVRCLENGAPCILSIL